MQATIKTTPPMTGNLNRFTGLLAWLKAAEVQKRVSVFCEHEAQSGAG
jgi:hypothetical protein